MLLLLACTPADPAPGRSEGPAEEAAAWPRPVVVALPYDDDANKASLWALLELAEDGTLVDTGERTEAGRGPGGRVSFIGGRAYAAQEDGSVGVFSFNPFTGSTLAGDFYASAVVEVDGEPRIVDGNWANNGGGLYTSEGERLLSSKLAADLDPWGDAWVLAATEADGGATGDDLHLVRDGAVVGGLDAFGDDEAWQSELVIHGDRAFIGDINEFGGYPTRVGVADLASGEPLASLEVEDPVSLAMLGDELLVASGYGDAILRYDPETLALKGSFDAELPSTIAVAGDWALVSEVGGVRVLGPAGEDRGVFSLGGGLSGIPGAIGVR